MKSCTPNLPFMPYSRQVEIGSEYTVKWSVPFVGGQADTIGESQLSIRATERLTDSQAVVQIFGEGGLIL